MPIQNAIQRPATAAHLSPLPHAAHANTAPWASVHTVRQGEGGLAHRSITTGSGMDRQSSLTGAARIASAIASGVKSGVKVGLKVLLGVAAMPVALAAAATGIGVGAAVSALTFIPALIHKKVIEPSAERKFQEANTALIDHLSAPAGNSVLNETGVVKRLTSYALKTRSPCDIAEIKQMVAIGENIAKALQSGSPTTAGFDIDESLPLLPDDVMPLDFVIDGKHHTINECNTYLARCVTWYMMAQAASQDCERAALGDQQGSDMVTDGALVMKDPGNRMYTFLNSAPTCSSRMSTHFEERTGHDEKYKVLGLFKSSKPDQRGIEDFQGKMPGQGGTVLFDRIRSSGNPDEQQLFVKFEAGGCPPLFRMEGGRGISGLFRFFAALDRNISHSFSFITTRFSNASGAEKVVRQEHVYKGAMKDISKEFLALAADAIKAGVIRGDLNKIESELKKFGLPYVQDAIATIGLMDFADTFSERRTRLNTQIAEKGRELDLVSSRHGIERRGAEVHIAL